MFEKTRERFANFIIPSGVGGVQGTYDVYDEQVLKPLITGTPSNTFQNSDAEKILAVTSSIKVLSDNIAKTPVKVFQKTTTGSQVDVNDYRYGLLLYSPDGIVDAYSFFGSLEYQRNLRGNAFARIHRDRVTGRVSSLEFIPSNIVSGYKKSRGQLYYIVHDKKGKDAKPSIINSINMLHFKMVAKNSIWGINPIEAQHLNLSTLYKSKNTMDAFYTNNAFIPRVLKTLIPDAQFLKPFAEAMKAWNKGGKLAGPQSAGMTATLPPFTEIQELGLNPIDEQYINSTKLDMSQISAFYGVPPDMIGVYDYSKYNNVEQAQLNFKVNTLSGIFRMYRQELEMKLLTTNERTSGKSIEFVTQSLIETDIASRGTYYKTMQDLGVMTPNQIALLEGLPTFEDGDKHYMSSQTVAIEDREANMETKPEG